MPEGIQFEEDNFRFDSSKRSANAGTSAGYGHPSYQSTEQKGMVGWLIRHGWARSGSFAQAILLGVVLVNVVITILIIMFML